MDAGTSRHNLASAQRVLATLARAATSPVLADRFPSLWRWCDGLADRLRAEWSAPPPLLPPAGLAG